jgi:monoamine oxidase
MEERQLNRRQMLAAMGGAASAAGAAALAWYLNPWQSRRGEAPFSHVPVVIGGEDNRVAHLLRDGRAYRVPSPSRRADVVVVGAGISGLTAAYGMKGAEVLVIEKETRPGGHARKGEWKGITYGEGAAYISDVSGYVGTLIDELRIPMKEIHEPGDAYYLGGQFTTDFWGKGADKLPLTAAARKGFKQFMIDVAALKDLPPLPVEKASAGALHYDTIGLAELLKPYGAEVLRYVDLYCRSALGGPVDEVSAYWGLNFLSGEVGKRYTAPGGNAAYGEALARAVGAERLVTGATVVRVANHGDKVWTTYVVGEESVTVESRAVVMATPKHFAKHVVADLPATQKEAMSRMRYEPYLVANVLVEGRPKVAAYDTWTGGAPFADVIVADWTHPDPNRRESVLTAYCPLPHLERHRLLDDAAVTAMGQSVVASLDTMYPGLGRQVAEVRAYRRGHPMVCSAVGALTDLRTLVTRPHGRVFFAHSDSQMAATIEAAVWEGQRAGAQALGAAKRVVATAGGTEISA